MAKFDYLLRVLQDHKVDILLLQETHVTQNSAQSRSRIPRLNFITIHHEKYGISSYGSQSIKAEKNETILEPDNIHRSAIRGWEPHYFQCLQTPETRRSNPPLPQNPHPAIIIRDFNSHHTDWGYADNSKAGDVISTWAHDTDLHLLFDPKEPGTFRSARWKRDYLLDLCFVTINNNLYPLNADRKDLDNFFHSQHRPILITVGMNIPTVQSIPIKSTMELPKIQLGKIHLRHWTRMRRNCSITGKLGNLWKTYPQLCKVEYTQG